MKEILKLNNAELLIPGGNLLWKIDSLALDYNDKIGLVGKNGSGKSMLFACISGEEDLTSGQIIKTEDVFYIPQQKNKTDSDILLSSILQNYGVTESQFLAQIETLIPHTDKILFKEMKSFSGGEYIKIFLVIANLLNRKLLLIDEPTNHLDSKGINYLKNWLNNYNGTFICISHDTYFLDSVTTKIWSLENRTIKVYGGNYSFFKRMKEMEKNSLLRQMSKKEKEINKINKALKKQNEKNVKNSREKKKNKHDKSISKFEIGYYIENSEKSGGKNAKKLSEKLQKAEEELEEFDKGKRTNIKLRIISNIIKGKLIDIKDGVLKVNNNIVENINFDISGGERMRLLGLNGVGKSLLLKSLVNKDSRENNLSYSKLYFSNNASIVYLDQFYDILNREKSIIENISDFAPNLPFEDVRKHLSNMLFKGDMDINKKVKQLSGGESVRVAIAMITSSNVDLLILDEPTNNLDIDTIDEFIDALKEFKGAIILITHNESFAERLGITKKYLIENKHFKKI